MKNSTDKSLNDGQDSGISMQTSSIAGSEVFNSPNEPEGVLVDDKKTGDNPKKIQKGGNLTALFAAAATGEVPGAAQQVDFLKTTITELVRKIIFREGGNKHHGSLNATDSNSGKKWRGDYNSLSQTELEDKCDEYWKP